MIKKGFGIFLVGIINLIFLNLLYPQNYFYITNKSGKITNEINSYIKNNFEILVKSNGVINTNFTGRIYIETKKVNLFLGKISKILGDSTTTEITSEYGWEEEGSSRYYGHTIVIKGRCLLKKITDSEVEDIAIFVSDARENVEKIKSTNIILSFIPYQSIYTDKIVINEVNYDTGYVWQKEWIEFYNTTSQTIDMNGFVLIAGDNITNKIVSSNAKIPPYGYLLLVANLNYFTNIFNWVKAGEGEYTNVIIIEKQNPTKSFRNNTTTGLYNNNYLSGDTITLLDASGKIIERLDYKHSWKPKISDISLERKDPLVDVNSGDNWGGSIDPKGCTPGKKNSIYNSPPILTDTSKIEYLEVSKKVFNPKKENIKIYYKLKKSSRIKISIYNSEGILIDELLNESLSADTREINFSGKDRAGNYLSPGLYIIYAEIIEYETKEIIKSSKSVIINYWIR